MEFSKFPRNVTFWPYFVDARGRAARRIRESTKLLGDVEGEGDERSGKARDMHRRTVGGGSEKERER